MFKSGNHLSIGHEKMPDFSLVINCETDFEFKFSLERKTHASVVYICVFTGRSNKGKVH